MHGGAVTLGNSRGAHILSTCETEDTKQDPNQREGRPVRKRRHRRSLSFQLPDLIRLKLQLSGLHTQGQVNGDTLFLPQQGEFYRIIRSNLSQNTT